MADDHLDRSVSLEASLTESGVKASAKSRFVTALDRLLGGALDWPAAYLDGKAQIRRLENEIVIKARKEIADIDREALTEIQRLEKSAEIAARLELTRGRLNAQAIAINALEDLNEAPPEQEIAGTIEEDWLNVLSSFSKLASSERLQALWGKILAGEVRQPGTFSVTTMRLISELDQTTANLFTSALNRYQHAGFLVLDSRNEGQNLLDIVALDELGYVNYGGGLILKIIFGADGKVARLVGDKLLIMTGQPEAEFTINVATLTRSGEQIRSLISVNPDDNIAAEKIVDQGGEKVSSATVYDVLEVLGNGQVRHNQLGRLLKG